MSAEVAAPSNEMTIKCPLERAEQNLNKIMKEDNLPKLHELVKIFKQTNQGLYLLAAYSAITKFEKLDESDCNAFRSFAQPIMLSLRTTTEYTRSLYETLKEDDNSARAGLYRNFRSELHNEAKLIVSIALQICDNLDKFPEDEGEFKLHLYTARVRADYSRYQFEIIGSEESKECAKKYNEAAWKTVLDRNLPHSDNHFCGIALNHSVYIHDVLGDPQQAIDFTEDFLKKCKAAEAEEAAKASENEGHLRSHGIPEIMNLMQENKKLWANKINDEKETGEDNLNETVPTA